MALNTNLMWFNALEKKFWGDKIESNPYFATVSIMLSLVYGLVLFVAGMISDSTPESSNIILMAAPTLTLLCGTLVCESIISAHSPSVALLRSLMLLVLVPVAFALGMLLGFVMMCIIALWLLFTIFSIATSSSGSSGKKKYILDDGTEVTEHKGLLGERTLRSDDGREFEHIPGSSDLVQEK